MMVSSLITQDIERRTAAPKINQEMISFPPLYVYSNLGKNPPLHNTFLNSKEKFT